MNDSKGYGWRVVLGKETEVNNICVTNDSSVVLRRSATAAPPYIWVMTATGSDEVLAAKFAVLLPQLDERQRRLLLGAEADALGRGGIGRVAAAAGVSRPTVTRGLAEVRAGGVGGGRVRRPGGGRKSLTETDPGLLGALEALVDPVTRGDPMSPLRWTTKSTRQLAGALTAAGHPVSHVRVGELLHSLGYSLQGNAKGRSRASSTRTGTPSSGTSTTPPAGTSRPATR